MTLDANQILNYEFKPIEFTWDEDKVILYHLGIGAGADWLNPDELRYTYEKHLHVLPTYGILASMDAMPDIVGSALLAEVNKNKIVHGEHELIVHRPMPTRGSVQTESRVDGVYNKRSGVLLVIQSDTRFSDSDELMMTNRWSLLLRGEETDASADAPETGIDYPKRDPDFVHELPIIPQLSQIYRLSGDKVAFHVDPDIAKLAGFETPIMHGLCTFGAVCKATVDSCVGGDVGRLTNFRGRFANPAFCGETIVTQIWEAESEFLIRAVSKEREQVLLSAAVSMSKH